MIVFYGSEFLLNVTNLKINFIEESAFFFDAFYKNYTPPFSLPLDEETSLKLGLIDIDNIAGYEVRHEGKLLIDTVFFDAYLVIEVADEQIEGSFYYGKQNLPLLETPLADLPFTTINNNTNAITLAKDYISKSWPEVSCNFPMVFDDDFKNESNYGAFLGIINNFDGTNFITNFETDADGAPLNKSILKPYPYIMEILKVGFESAGKQITGAFVNKKENAHLLLDVANHLEEFLSTTFNNFQFANPTDQVIIDNSLVSEYKESIGVSDIGTYNISIAVNLPKTVTVKRFQLIENNVVLFETTSNAINQNFSINKQNASGTITLDFILQLEGSTNDISDYNNFTFEKSEGKLNIYKRVFSLSEIMPDLTFGGFLQKLKNWLNLKIEIYPNYVVIDYVEDFFDVITYKDETALEITNPKREFNKIKRYKLTTSNPDAEIYVGKLGLSATIDDVRTEDIKTIETGVSLYNIEERSGVFTALKNNNADFGILIYNGLDANGYPVAVSQVEGCSFSLQEIYTKYWRKWLYFRLNSETYTDKFTAHSLEEFSPLVGRFKYNKKHLIKKITKSRISEEQYQYEIISETL